ncbi:MAG TPA: Sir2 family NAD-dependent protein deacetylase [Anaeromyxobacteraceae bacterium]|nr:Sir2 family NAD-dependent protein deacetylase [Anaeromyxobacteraceae bacterium]
MDAAEIVRWADALVVLSGPGMGADSGLPDLHDDRQFWRAYPPYERLGLRFVDVAHPEQFERAPELAWGFYGHRQALYRAARPHHGYEILRRWTERLAKPTAVATTCVDGLFLRAGFAREAVAELHGSIDHLQCLAPCCDAVWSWHDAVPIDPATMRARALPYCPACGGVARPNVLMLGDERWLSWRADGQRERLEAFLDERAGPGLAVLELGASAAFPVLRHLSEELARHGATVVCVNAREPGLSPPHVALRAGPLAGLSAIEAALTA